MSSETFFKDSGLPFAECRYSTGSKREYKPHLHSTFSIGAMDSGKVEYRVVDQSSILEVGSLALINPELLHSCNPVSEQGRSYYMLYLDVAWCLQVQQAMWEVDQFIFVEKIRVGMDIGEAALECGFFDQSHLHRHFKAMTTVTPKEYRVNFVQ